MARLMQSAEARYLIDLSARLGFVSQLDSGVLDKEFASLSAKLESLVRALETRP